MDRREGNKTQREMVEVGRDLKGREQGLEGGCVTDSFRTILFYIFVNCSYFILLFFVCELFIINFFLLFNLCGLFFLLSFVFLFVCLFVFFCYTLPCFLLVLGDWAYRVICFVVYCLFFFKFILFFFFYLHGFSGFIFCKFNCFWHFFTSSDRVPPGGVARGPRFADWYRGVVSYTNDDLGKRVA